MELKTGIQQRIIGMIVDELDRYILGSRRKDKVEMVNKYRDANFLSGHYDHVFEDYIHDNNLKNE